MMEEKKKQNLDDIIYILLNTLTKKLSKSGQNEKTRKYFQIWRVINFKLENKIQTIFQV